MKTLEMLIPQPVLERLSSLPEIHGYNPSGPDSTDFNITWNWNRTNPQMNKGLIRLQWANKIEAYQHPYMDMPVANHPKYLLTHIEPMDHQKGVLPKPNDDERLTLELSMIATLNRAALAGEKPIVHVARAVNEREIDWFNRLSEIGVYSPCDQEGNIIETPIKVSRGGFMPYIAKYPIEGIEGILEKFVFTDTVSEIARLNDKVVR